MHALLLLLDNLNLLKYIFLTFNLLISIGIEGYAQSFEINGKISSAHHPIPFANVVIEKIHVGAVSDENGLYKLKGVPNGTYTILVSSIGYKKLEKKIDKIKKVSRVRSIKFKLGSFNNSNF